MLQFQPFLDFMALMGEHAVSLFQHPRGQSHRLCHPVESCYFHSFCKMIEINIKLVPVGTDICYALMISLTLQYRNEQTKTSKICQKK